MKKVLSIFLIISMITSLSACGSATSTTTTAETVATSTELKSKTIETEAATAAIETENTALESDMEELSAIGEVEVENGILTVTLTLPADFVGETTHEELDKLAGSSYMYAKLNDDGSVTYKMTKAQHKEMLSNLKTSIDESIEEIINDKESYSIKEVNYNDDCTVFDVTLDGTELGFMDSFSMIIFYMYGGIYNIFTGNKTDSITVNFYDHNGNFLESGNSAEAGQ